MAARRLRATTLWLLLAGVMHLSSGKGWNRGAMPFTKRTRRFPWARLVSFQWTVRVRGGTADETSSQEQGDDDGNNAAVLTQASELDSGDLNVSLAEGSEVAVVDENDPSDESITLAREQAQALREMGKTLHDAGDWDEAAITFYNASLVLSGYPELLEDFATCRLHEALCHLKTHSYEKCVEACSAVLERELPTSFRARALHRRSRAKQGLEQTEDALDDARSAAFLGDRKAVALYGKLMRQDADGEESPASSLQDLFGGGSNPFLAAASNPPGYYSSSSALLESLLNESPKAGSASSNPMSTRMNGNNGEGGLAKSVLSSLSKQIDKESTQETICQYLQNTNAAQIQQFASMAGVPLSERYAFRLVSFCHGVTPKGIRRSVKTTKRIWYGISLLRKVSQILTKYRQVVVLWALLSWIKSALQRPIPVNKRAARLAMNQALKQGAV